MFALRWSILGLVASISAVPVEVKPRSTEIPFVAQSTGQTVLLNDTAYYIPGKPEVHILAGLSKQFTDEHRQRLRYRVALRLA